MSDTGPALAAVAATAPEQGSKAAAERALAAVPMQQEPPTPGQRGPITRPTERPNEPVTAGLPSGPGPGPRPLPGPRRSDAVVARAIGLLQASGDPRLAILVGRLQQKRRQ